MKTTNAVASRQRRKKVLSQTKGMGHARRSGYRMGKQSVIRALQYAYRDRRNKKRTFRSLWIGRLNSALRLEGLTYSKFIPELKAKGITLNRKTLSEIAAREPDVFKRLVKSVTEAK